jgi:hypothetical protein
MREEWAVDLADLRRRRPIFAGEERENADIYQELFWDSMWSPEAEGCSLIENTSFCGFSAGLHRPNHLAAVGRILVFGGLAAIAGLEFTGLWHQAHFAGKSPSYASLKSKRPTSVHRSGIGLESGGPDTQHIGFRQRTCQRWHLLRAFETACGPLGPEGRSLTENTPFGGFSAGLCHLNQLAVVAEILVFGGLAATFAELEFTGLLNRQRFAAKRSGYASR